MWTVTNTWSDDLEINYVIIPKCECEDSSLNE